MASVPEFDRLEDALRTVGSPVVDAPSQPAEPDEVRAQLAPLGLEPPPGLTDWFGWRNGVGGVPGMARVPGDDRPYPSSLLLGRMIALPLADAVEEYRTLRRDLGGEDDFAYEHGWFPVLAGWATIGAVCVDCTTQPGSIVLWDPQAQRPADSSDRIFDSIGGLIELYVTAIENEWVRIDHSSMRPLDFDPSIVPEERWDPLLSL